MQTSIVENDMHLAEGANCIAQDARAVIRPSHIGRYSKHPIAGARKITCRRCRFLQLRAVGSSNDHNTGTGTNECKHDFSSDSAASTSYDNNTIDDRCTLFRHVAQFREDSG
jgi:hypothetical protein